MSLTVDIKKKYEDFTLDIKFEAMGWCLGILGASGCGKSLTLKCIAGIEEPDQGRITLNGRVLFDSENKVNITPQLRNIGLLFQNYALFPNMTVKENIVIGIKNKKGKKVILEKMVMMFRLEGLLNRYPGILSGGEQQRVAMARMLASEPEVLMLDEPFSALDSYLKEQLQLELMEVLGNYSGDILMVSHDRDELYRFCNNIAVIDHGKMIEKGCTYQIFHNPVNPAAARLTGCKNISGAVKLSDYEIRAVDWNLNLTTDQFVDDDIRYVGIRAHDLKASFHIEAGNTLPVQFTEFSEGLFENNIIFTSINPPEGENKIWWKVTKQDWENLYLKKIPQYIMFPKEALLLLR